ncbi:integrase-like protein [Anseongella ginsenosidimutans]|uniref:Integrase-like protein n=2 Tax=Anseongella ginsenosidimutans TaxID=496056 RepID=A0A4R3KQP3_9SPHI|nr:integrase-like protein [Anseongella ginsenosidimutans]
MSGTREAAKSFNAYLDILLAKVQDTHRSLLEGNAEITAQNIKNKLTGKAGKARLLLELFQEYNRKIRALIGNGFEESTLKGYRTTLNHLNSFLQWKYHVSDIDINRLDHEFITDFEFLRSEVKIGANAAAKYIKNLKKVVNDCLAKGWLRLNPFLRYRSKAKPTERVFLTKSELEAIASKILYRATRPGTGHLFILLLYGTGLRGPNSTFTGGVDHYWPLCRPSSMRSSGQGAARSQ